MLGHESGMIGFPLRLLARENYDRIVKVKGASQVAPDHRRGEDRPARRALFRLHRRVHAARPAGVVPRRRRGADGGRSRTRAISSPTGILHARGTNETMLLGADTIRPVLNRLLPDIDVVARPRFSKLTYVGPKKATRLPRRSAVVGFSASEVYAIAELIRRQRGGTAIVMGA
jgi:ATP-dependent RNA helicase SUPV3L1/SUV3